MRAQFEEKTYEQYFNIELGKKSTILYPPGQCAEGLLGFDMAVYSRSGRLWNIFGDPLWYYFHYRGENLRNIANDLERYLRQEIDAIPSIKANLLIQYKRPEYIALKNGKEWKHWRKEYYRYDIYNSQQKLLSHISRSFYDKVLVIYAAPSTWSIDKLIEFYKNGTIIENSNFTKAILLDKHSRNTYIEAGRYSIGCSEPERIESLNLVETISDENLQTRYYFSEDPQRSTTNSEAIIVFREGIQDAVAQGMEISSAFNALNNLDDYYRKFPLLYSFLVMRNFRAITGIQWLFNINLR